MITMKMYKHSMPSCLDNIAEVVKQILRFVEDCHYGINEDSLFELKVILNELLCNAVKHGNNADINKAVRICVLNRDNNVIQIVVRDRGKGFDYSYIRNSCPCNLDCDNFLLLKETGRGLLIVKALCQSINFNKKGNTVSIIKSL